MNNAPAVDLSGRDCSKERRLTSDACPDRRFSRQRRDEPAVAVSSPAAAWRTGAATGVGG